MMLSSAGHRGDAKRCREIGVAAYLTKPVGRDELLEAILTALGVRPAPEAPASVVTRHPLHDYLSKPIRPEELNNLLRRYSGQVVAEPRHEAD